MVLYGKLCSGKFWQVGFVRVLFGMAWSELVRFGWAGEVRYVVVCYVLVRYVEAGEVSSVTLSFGGLWSGRCGTFRWGMVW